MNKKRLLLILAITTLTLTACANTKQADETVNNMENRTEISDGEDLSDKTDENSPVSENQIPPLETEETVKEEVPEASAGDSASSAEGQIQLENPQPDADATALMAYTFEKEYKDDNGNVFGKVTFTIPQLTLRSVTAGTINQEILQNFEARLEWADETAEPLEDWDDSESLQYTMETGYRMTYVDNDRISILLEGYEYTGGAHGMPFREALIYDLGSGERLYAEDLFDVSEEEFAALFNEAYEKLINASPDTYWVDAMDYVKEEANFSNQAFYLTDEGVTFYFDPYILAAYAEGYIEVTIPYEKLPLKSVSE